MADLSNAPPVPSATDTDLAQKPVYMLGAVAHVGDTAVQHLGFLNAVDTQTSVPSAFSRERLTGDHALVMVYQDCPGFMFDRMRAGDAPQAALDQWTDHARDYLRCLRSFRREALSVSLDQLLRNPAPTRALLTELHGYLFRNDAPGPVPAAHETDPVTYFLACDAFRKSPGARRLQAELDASSRVPRDVETAPSPDLDTVHSSLGAMRRARDTLQKDAQLAAAELEHKGRQISDTAGALARSQAKLEEQARRHAAEIKKLEGKLDARKAELRSAESARAALQAQADATEAELRGKLDWAQEELGKALSKISNVEAELQVVWRSRRALEADLDTSRSRAEELTQDRQRAEAETETARQDATTLREEADHLNRTLSDRDAYIDALHNSRSWKITKPLRRVRQLFGRG